MGVFTFLQLLAQMGVGVYLLRREGEERETIYHQAFTLLLVSGAVGMCLALLGLPFLERWVRLTDFGSVALVLFLGLPVALSTEVPLARLGRALAFKRVAVVELVGLSAFYATAVPLALAGLGVAAPLVGWWVQQLLLLILLFYAARYSPRLHWDFELAKEMISYGSRFSVSNWIWQLRDLVNPLVVGRFLGAEAVGYVALTMRLLKGLAFVKEAVWRISLAALARVQHDRTRLVRMVTEGMNLQLIAAGPLSVAFGLVAPRIVPLLFGTEWLRVLEVYPFLALGTLTSAVFMLHASTLYVLGQNLKVGVFHLLTISKLSRSAIIVGNPY